ncbi:hypothetical protein [Neobacillus sp. 114]|nr:hypothetical protein [Neobacillus sp. 114]
MGGALLYAVLLPFNQSLDDIREDISGFFRDISGFLILSANS